MLWALTEMASLCIKTYLVGSYWNGLTLNQNVCCGLSLEWSHFAPKQILWALIGMASLCTKTYLVGSHLNDLTLHQSQFSPKHILLALIGMTSLCTKSYLVGFHWNGPILHQIISCWISLEWPHYAPKHIL